MGDNEYQDFTEYLKEYNRLHEVQEKLATQIWEINQTYHLLEQRIEELDRLFRPYWQDYDDRIKGVEL